MSIEFIEEYKAFMDRAGGYQEKELSRSSEIMPRNIKSQILNNLKSILEDLYAAEFIKEPPDEIILNIILTNLLVIEDAARIDMYKFQFSALTNILTVEIKNIQDMAGLS